jgi:hypothetical protein
VLADKGKQVVRLTAEEVGHPQLACLLHVLLVGVLS